VQWSPGVEVEGVIEGPYRSGDEQTYPARCPTLEGIFGVSPGDWIITGVNGEKYPCKPDIFAKTYDAAEGPATRETLAALATALECVHEHLGSCWSALRGEGREVGVAGDRPRFPLGAPEYHLAAVDEQAHHLVQLLYRALPDLDEVM
jgi:hypothetical protein